MKIKMILPALTEAKSPYWRPVKYSLFPPLGLATLAALWNFIIKTKGLNNMLPILEAILSKVNNRNNNRSVSPFPAIA